MLYVLLAIAVLYTIYLFVKACRARRRCLFEAIKQGRYWAVKEVLTWPFRRFLVNFIDWDSDYGTPLFLALRLGYDDILELLLLRGANPNDVDVWGGYSPLHLVMQKDPGKRVTAYRLLLARGADPNRRFESTGQTPLHLAVLSGDLDAVKALLAEGAKQTPDHEGITPAALARQHGREDLAALIEQYDPI